MHGEHGMQNETILITGATGYVGGRLVRRLYGAGRPIRCLARTPAYLRSRLPEDVSVVPGDVLDRRSLTGALEGVSTAYYLVHSMGTSSDFEEDDRRAATNFAMAARTAGVRRIIYLGGLASGPDLSPHLRSRNEVGEILRNSGVPTIEFRASIVIGSGSLSFELVRSLTERLPVMLTPSWVRLKTQPIGVEDLLDYLAAALDVELESSEIVEIGGADVVSYSDLIREYAQQRGLRRMMIPVPVLTPTLSSLWLGLVTPLFARVGRKLIEGLRNETVVQNPAPARRYGLRPRGIHEAISRALVNEDRSAAETRWSDAVSATGPSPAWGGVKFGNRIVDTRTARVATTPSEAWTPIRRLGGDEGWYHANPLWRLRGALDLLVGGPGFRRGRPDPEALRAGDPVDFWRVEDVRTPESLRLVAEMKLPGRAWLQFDIEGVGSDGCTIRQTAIFDPVGLAGRLYWYALYPLHASIFRGMLSGIAARAESIARSAHGAARRKAELAIENGRSPAHEAGLRAVPPSKRSEPARSSAQAAEAK